jgi:hypothetical protein
VAQLDLDANTLESVAVSSVVQLANGQFQISDKVENGTVDVRSFVWSAGGNVYRSPVAANSRTQTTHTVGGQPVATTGQIDFYVRQNNRSHCGSRTMESFP